MFSSAIFDVVIGVIFGFLTISLLTSAAVEGVNSILKLRATGLKEAVKALVNDPEFSGLAMELYRHSLISPLASGEKSQDVYNLRKNLPSYIDKLHFARALLDVTGLTHAGAQGAAQLVGPQAAAALKVKIDAIKDDQIRTFLQGAYVRAGGNIEKIETAVAGWFDSSMDRVSGAFKRQTQVLTFFVAFLLAAFVNIDTIHIATEVWRHPELIARAKSENPVALKDAGQTLDTLVSDDFPIGWNPEHVFEQQDEHGQWKSILTGWRPAIVLVGWLMTAIASMFGAAFWFDALSGAIQISGAGRSPNDKPK